MSETASLSALTEPQPMPRDPVQASSVPPAGPAAVPPDAPVSAPAAAPLSPGGGIGGLLELARAAQARLGGQPLPIANHDMMLVMKLLGG